MSEFQTLAGTVAAVMGDHVIVQALPPGGGDPIVMRAPAGTTRYHAGDQVHVRARSKVNILAEALAAPGGFGELTPAPPRPEDVLALIDQAVANAAPVVHQYPPTASGPPAAPVVYADGIIKATHPRDYAMPPDMKAYAKELNAVSQAGYYVRGLITGPTGVGKSTFVQAFAAEHNRPYCRVTMSGFVAPDEIFGQRTLEKDDGGTMTGYDETPLVRAFQTPNCVIQVDEINLVHPSVNNVLMNFLDDMGTAYVPGLNRTIAIAPGLIVFATANIGAAYAGTFQLNAAMLSRLSYPIELNYLPEDVEVQVLIKKTGVQEPVARSLVQFAEDIRRRADPDEPVPLDFGISTRQLLAASALVAAGGAKPSEAVRRTILPLFSPEGGKESQRAVVAGILQGRFA